MRSVYGDVCPDHPELAGRRYLPNKACIKCHSERNKVVHAKRKAAQKARDERLAKCEALLREVWEIAYEASPYKMVDLYQRIDEVLNAELQ